MKSLSSYLILIFMIMFWIFRMIVAFTTSMAINIGFTPLNMNTEIVLLFVVIPCIILVAKRKVIGAIIYVIAYGAYFGVDLYNLVMQILDGGTITNYSNALTSFIGVVLPVSVLFNTLLDKNKTSHPVDKKTDWFYKGEQYDRKIDERADQNQYKNY